jgi:hypothetical protein
MKSHDTCRGRRVACKTEAMQPARLPPQKREKRFIYKKIAPRKLAERPAIRSSNAPIISGLSILRPNFGKRGRE